LDSAQKMTPLQYFSSDSKRFLKTVKKRTETLSTLF